MKNVSKWMLAGVLAAALPAGFNFGPHNKWRHASAQDGGFDNKKIVPFVPSPQEVVDKMIDLAGVRKGDVVYDMGSGDGRIVIAAAKRGAQATGFEIDGDLVKESRENIRKAGLQNSADIRQRDFDGRFFSGVGRDHVFAAGRQSKAKTEFIEAAQAGVARGLALV